MIEDVTVCNFSWPRSDSTLHPAAKFGRYFGRAPDRLSLENVRAYQSYLVRNEIPERII